MAVKKGEKPKQARSARGAQAREKLKNAAMAVLERQGYHQMRVTDVTREAGVAAGLFYHYFSDLKSLTLEVLTDFIERLEAYDEIEKDVQKGDWYARIQSHMAIMVEVYAEHPGIMRCLLQFSDEQPEFRELYKQSFSRQLQWMALLMPRMFPNSELSESETLLVLYALGGAAETLLREYYITRDSVLCSSALSNEEMTELLAVMFYRGLFLESPATQQLRIADKLERVSGAAHTDIKELVEA